MSTYPYRQDREEIRELLEQFENLKKGLSHPYLEEDAFERIIDHYDAQEQLYKALEAARYGIERYPYSSPLLLRKADLLIATRQYHEALDVLDQAEILDSGEKDLFILRIDAYLALDWQDRAAAVLDEVLLRFEGDEKVDVLFELADVYDDYEQFDRVFECLKMILETDPNNEEALYKVCFWTDFTGRNEEGIRLHQQIINDYPYNELAWFNLAAAYQGIKLYEKAIDAYQFAIAIDEKFDYAYRNMGDALLRLHRYKEAIEVLEKVLELARPEDVIYEAIGHCYDKMKQYNHARSNYKKASHLSKDDSQLHYKIACTYMNEKQWDNAIKSLERALQLHRMQPEYNLAIGQCYRHLGRVEDAISCLSNVVRLRPKSMQGWSELLNCLYQAGFIAEMLESAELAAVQTDGKPLFLFYKSAALFALGKSKEALLQLEMGMEKNAKLLKKFIEINPSILQNQQVVDIIARFKKNKSI
jgi:tetratricopeptide (TPR) repeat protein